MNPIDVLCRAVSINCVVLMFMSLVRTKDGNRVRPVMVALMLKTFVDRNHSGSHKNIDK